MKQPTFCGRELLSLSVIEAARAGDPLAGERRGPWKVSCDIMTATRINCVPGHSTIWTVCLM